MKICPGQRLSIGCALSVGRQCVEAIEEVHRIGFIHRLVHLILLNMAFLNRVTIFISDLISTCRDIKPSNFAIGRHEHSRNIYLIDFGLAHQYVDSDDKIRKPRKVCVIMYRI